MAYTKHTWTHNETITKENLNHMEEGIYQNAEDISHFVAPNYFSATLSAGSTTVTFTDASIGEAEFIAIFTSNGVGPVSQSVSASTYTATFEAQSADMDVMIEVR